MIRTPITTIAELEALDGEEVLAGYLDGFRGEDEPGDNHSLGYWHGWRNGASDRSGVTDAAQQKLAHAIVEAGWLRGAIADTTDRLDSPGRT